jgi:hypothetical protein
VKPSHPVDLADNLELVTALGSRDQRAVNVNTIDEVPDSSWFTNRVADELSLEEIARGPLVDDGPARGTWTILDGDSSTSLPRLTARDSGGTVYELRFDMASDPERATGADAVSTRLVHALGYHTALNYLTFVRAGELAIGAGAAVNDGSGRRRMMTRVDLEILLDGAARTSDGRYRAIASRLPAGTDLGPFKFSGLRRDDPNDIFPHQHRRELRGLRVICAWLNHDDTRSLETRDVLVDAGGRRVLRHLLVDFGSTLGGGAHPGAARTANEYAWVARPKLKTALTLGFWVRPWDQIAYPDLPPVGRYEAAFFDPEHWAPRYRNAAFDRARADDEFWAARRVIAITDDAIRAIVGAARYSDAAAAAYLAETLIARRDAIARAFLNGVLPLADCELAPEGTLACANVAVDAEAATPADEYRIRWHRFDNQTGTAAPFGDESSAPLPRFTAPAGLLASGEFVMAEIRGLHPRLVSWAAPMKAYFRRTADGWRMIGLDRSVPAK